MDLETLYKMVKAASNGAANALNLPGHPKGTYFDHYGGYLSYMLEYNRLLPFVHDLFGEEARLLFQPIPASQTMTPANVAGVMWRPYLEEASVHLASLAAYIQGKLPSPLLQVESLIDLIEDNLRPALYDRPDSERSVQNALETILRARKIEFDREHVAIPYSGRDFKPDFTLPQFDLALEVKLCNADPRAKQIVEEINADIPAYRTKFTHTLFVVFDLGFIRDTALFKSGIQQNPGVSVLVVKW